MKTASSPFDPKAPDETEQEYRERRQYQFYLQYEFNRGSYVPFPG